MVELLNFVLKFCLLLCSRKKSMTLKVSPDSNINIYVVFWKTQSKLKIYSYIEILPVQIIHD